MIRKNKPKRRKASSSYAATDEAMMNRPTPMEFKTEAAFLDAVAVYVMRVRKENLAYGLKIDRANEFAGSANAIRTKGNVCRKSKAEQKTMHDILNENPVLRAMHKQGRLF